MLQKFFPISDQYTIFNYFSKWPPAVTIFVHNMATGSHLVWPKITFDRISRHFRSIVNTQHFFFKLFHKMAAAGHFGLPKITVNRMFRFSNQYSSFFDILFTKWLPFWVTENHFRLHFLPFQINTELFFFSQNGRRWPFWMTENHFRSHFSPFQINTQLLFFVDTQLFFHNMATGSHLLWPKLTFDRISRHFRSIGNFLGGRGGGEGGSLHCVLIVIHHKLQLTLKMQLGVERHLPKCYTFKDKITDMGS